MFIKLSLIKLRIDVRRTSYDSHDTILQFDDTYSDSHRKGRSGKCYIDESKKLDRRFIHTTK